MSYQHTTRSLTVDETADYLDAATVEHTLSARSSVVNMGNSPNGQKFVMVNDCYGNTTVIEYH